MRILLIEDDQEWARTVLQELEPHVFVHCLSRDSAIAVLNAGEFFDVVVCDLRLPASDGGLGADVIHGQAVVAESRDAMPGTPIVVFSAFGDDQVLPQILNDAPNGDPFGRGDDHGMVRYIRKGRILECVEVLRDLANEVERLEAIGISRGTAQQLSLSPKEERILRVLGSLRGGRVVKVSPLTGGLSGSHTLSVRIEDAAGARVYSTVAKLGDVADLAREHAAAGRIGGNMPAAAFAPVVDFVKDGASDVSGLCYSVADGYDKTLFEYLLDSPEEGAAVVEELRAATEGMREGAAAQAFSVAELRQLTFPELETESFSSAVLDGTAGTDGIEIQARPCLQHGDFHGANVLVDSQGRPIVIDHARAGRHSIALDALTLELGFVFHPAARDLAGDWPSPEQARNWDDLDRWLVDCPVAGLVGECREWAFDTAASDEEVFAVVGALALRNLQFERPDLAEVMALRAFELLGH